MITDLASLLPKRNIQSRRYVEGAHSKLKIKHSRDTSCTKECIGAGDQCEGCTFNTGHVLELSYLHSRDVTFAVFCEGPFDESNLYREFMG